jgi:hypothetical protein
MLYKIAHPGTKVSALTGNKSGAGATEPDETGPTWATGRYEVSPEVSNLDQSIPYRLSDHDG